MLPDHLMRTMSRMRRKAHSGEKTDAGVEAYEEEDVKKRHETIPNKKGLHLPDKR